MITKQDTIPDDDGLDRAGMREFVRRETRIISTNTALNLGLVVTLLGGAWFASRWGTRMEDKLDHSVELLELKIDRLRTDIQAHTNDRWWRVEQLRYHGALRQWSELLGARNPDIVMPVFPTMPLTSD